jgi:hypothetical protein
VGGVGPGLPTPGQLARLKQLSDATGERYVPPRTRKQARARIRDLEVRARGRVRYVHPEPRERTHDDFLRALRNLKRECYREDADPARIADLERTVDRLVEVDLAAT